MTAEFTSAGSLFELLLSHAQFSMNVVAATGDASPVSRSYFPALQIPGTAVRMEQPASNSNINGVFEVIAVAFHQQHHELKFWGDEDIEKAIDGEAGMVSAWRSIFPLVRRGRLPLITCSRLWWRFGTGKVIIQKLVVAMVSFSSNWVGDLQQIFRFVDLVILHFLACQAIVNTWETVFQGENSGSVHVAGRLVGARCACGEYLHGGTELMLRPQGFRV